MIETPKLRVASLHINKFLVIALHLNLHFFYKRNKSKCIYGAKEEKK